MLIGNFGGHTAGRTIDDVVADARAAEQDGFATYALSQTFGFDAMGVLAIVGREVPRIELATGVVPTYGRHPLTMAQQALTVQAASGGRFTLGIGLSHQIVIENMFGLSFDKPLRHMREYLDVLMPLLTDGKAEVDGETISTHAAIDVPDRTHALRCSSPRSGPKMLELAGTRHRRHRHLDDRTRDALLRTSSRSSPPRPSARAVRRRASSPACRSASRTTSTPRASAPRRTSRSTGSCRRTAPCSTAKARPDRPTSRSSATRRRSPRSSAGSPTRARPSSSRRSSAIVTSEPRPARC